MVRHVDVTQELDRIEYAAVDARTFDLPDAIASRVDE
ncbi:MAG: hypothetical protein ACI835_003678 [Planctomycetota bacterium]|jgi:hypothetical protein